MDLSTITVSDFKTYFRRDFPYAPTYATENEPENLDSFVFDSDIEKAFGEAKTILNQGLFGDDDSIRLAYLYLSAHYLVIDLRAAMGGVDSTGSFPVASRSVGSVAESYAIPDAYKDNAQYAFFTTTGYGMKFLSMVIPRLVGNIRTVAGWTLP